VENKKNISNKIKESFESQSFEAPKDMWSTISSDLDYKKLDDKIKSSFVAGQFSAPAFDFSVLDNTSSALDNKISESFEQTEVAAPDNAWDGIEDKLDVNIVWDKLSNEIVVNNRTWTKLMVAASIVLLVSVLPSTIKNQEFKSKSEFNTTIELVNSSSIENDLITDNNSIIPTIVNNNSDLNHSVITFEEQGVLAQLPTQNQLKEAITNDGISSNRIELLRTTEISQVENNWNDIVYNSSDLNKWEELSKHPIERVKKKSSKSGFRFGVVGGISSSWILDNDTRESFDKTSLNDSKLSVGQMYGVTADYYFNNHNGLEANILINAQSKNRIGYYENGVYKIRKTEINYFKTTLLYNRRINFYGKKSNHSITLGGGPYVGLNRNSNIIENETITSLNSQFKKVNYGLTLRLGEEIEWYKFVLGYGVNSELGLRNIFKAETIPQSDMNFTNNVDLGLFVSLKYKL